MGLLEAIIAGLISSTTVIAIAGFIARETFARVLNRRLEIFKHELGIEAKTRELTLKSQIEFKERQLAEFYGPIYALLKRGRPIYDHWAKGKLKEITSDVESLFVDANNQILNILLNKSHLIQGNKIPDSFIHFLTHVAVWHAFLKTNHKGVPFSKEEFPEAYYNDEFENEIFNTTESLKLELDGLYHHYGLLASKPNQKQIQGRVELAMPSNRTH